MVLIPLGSGDAPDSVVLRPIHSVDGMPAQVVRMERALLDFAGGRSVGGRGGGRGIL